MVSRSYVDFFTEFDEDFDALRSKIDLEVYPISDLEVEEESTTLSQVVVIHDPRREVSFRLEGPAWATVDQEGRVTLAPPKDAIGEFSLTVVVADGIAEHAESFVVTVVEKAIIVVPEVSYPSVSTATLGEPFSLLPDTWTGVSGSEMVGTLPDGLALNVVTGEISGTLTPAGLMALDAEGLVVRATSIDGVTADSAPFTIQVTSDETLPFPEFHAPFDSDTNDAITGVASIQQGDGTLGTGLIANAFIGNLGRVYWDNNGGPSPGAIYGRTKPFIAATWIRTAESPSVGTQWVIDRVDGENGGFTAAGWDMAVVDGKFAALLRLTGTHAGVGASAATFRVDDGEWHLAAFEFDPSTLTGRLLVDGVEVGRGVGSGTVRNDTYWQTFDLSIRSHNNHPAGGYFNGDIDETTFFGQLLTDAQWATLVWLGRRGVPLLEWIGPQVSYESTTATLGEPFSLQPTSRHIASYSVVSGTLPDGLTLNPTTGEISGVLTVAGLLALDAEGIVVRGTGIGGAFEDSAPFTITVQGVPVPMPTHLWRMEAVSSPVPDEGVGTPYDATIVGSPALEEALVGHGRRLVSGDSSYMTVPVEAFNIGTADYSLFAVAASSGEVPVIRGCEDGAWSSNFGVYRSGIGFTLSPSYGPNLRHCDGSRARALRLGSTPIEDTDFHVIGASVDRAADASLYLDGQPESFGTNSEGSISEQDGAIFGEDIPTGLIGAKWNSSYQVPGTVIDNTSDGVVDEVAIWIGTVLTAEQHATLAWLSRRGVPMTEWAS